MEVSGTKGYSMKNTCAIIVFVVGLSGLTACQHQPFPSPPIYEDQSQYVRLAVDHAVGGGHSHPASLTIKEMAAVLSGVMIEEPTRLLPSSVFFDMDNTPQRHPAFSAAEIAFVAPLLTKGLESAKSEEIVVFYQITQKPGTIDLVTSGGVFIHGDELHFLLSNYRSPTRYPPDAETMSYVDGRLTPLQSIAPQEVKVDFQPISARAPSQQKLWHNPFRPKQRELVVLFKQLTAGTAEAAQ